MRMCTRCSSPASDDEKECFCGGRTVPVQPQQRTLPMPLPRDGREQPELRLED